MRAVSPFNSTSSHCNVHNKSRPRLCFYRDSLPFITLWQDEHCKTAIIRHSCVCVFWFNYESDEADECVNMSGVYWRTYVPVNVGDTSSKAVCTRIRQESWGKLLHTLGSDQFLAYILCSVLYKGFIDMKLGYYGSYSTKFLRICVFEYKVFKQIYSGFNELSMLDKIKRSVWFWWY